MSPQRFSCRSFAVLASCLVLLLSASALRADSRPQVEKMEPPNWWVGLPPSPLMLLLTGENLSGASVSVDFLGVRVTRTDWQASGRYLFVWLEVDPATKPGSMPLTVQTPQGSTVVPFSLHPRRAQAGNFQGLSRDDVIYLIMPDRFANGDPGNDQPARSPDSHDRANPRAYHGGDLRGIRERLPYLRNLGITALWLNPVYDNHDGSPQDYHGYGAVDFYAVDEHLGTLADLQELVAAAHRHGIKVFLDSVANHTGPHHPWVTEPPTADWFHGTAENHLAARAPFEHLTDPHALPQHWRDLVQGWFANVLPDLNQENPRVAQYLLQNSLWWAEQTGLDGYRLDTFPYLTRNFWADWHRGLHRAYPQLATIGEVFHPDVAVAAYFAGGQVRGDGIDSGVTTVFDFPFYFALRAVLLRGAPVTRLKEVLQRDWLYAKPERLVTFLGNHDVRRFASEPGSSIEKLKLAYSLLLTVRGIPQLYYGDEIGMEGGDDPDNRRDFPGGFPGDVSNAFTVEGRRADEQEIFSHVQGLLRLRRAHPALRRGRHWHLAWDETLYAFVRESGKERLLVVFNNARQARNLRLDFTNTPLAATQRLVPLFAARPAVVRGGQAELTVAPRSVAIYVAK